MTSINGNSQINHIAADSTFLSVFFKEHFNNNGLTNDQIMLIIDQEGIILSCNRCDTKKQQRNIIGQHFSILLSQNEISNEIHLQLLDEAFHSGGVKYQTEWIQIEDREFKAELDIYKISADLIKNGHYIISIRYIERKLTHRSIKLISDFNQAAAKLSNDSSIYRKFSQIIKEIGTYDKFWIGNISDDPRKQIKPVAQIGLDKKKITALQLSLVKKDTNLHPIERAICTGQTVVVQNIYTDTNFSEWLEDARDTDYSSLIAIPFSIDRKVAGVINIYSRQPYGFTEEEIKFLETLANHLSFGLELARHEKANKEYISEYQENEKRFSLAFREANDGVWDWNISTNRVFFSPRWKMILGFSENEIGDSPDEWFSRVHLEDRYQLEVDITPQINGLLSDFESEHRILHKDGTYHWVQVQGLSVWDKEQNTQRIFGTMTDISERKNMEERLKHDAMHDQLTGLPNRSYFIDQMIRAIDRTKRQSKSLSAVLIIDIDRFNIINDSLGHAFGDLMLVEISKRIKSCLRASDISSRFGEIVSRFGGDEFGILVDGINDVSDTTRISTRIQSELAEPITLHGHELFISVSIGIAIITKQYECAQELLRDAETALYRAKAGGRARYQIFDVDMHAQSLALLQMESDLRRAIDHTDFYLVYQPIISLANRDIIKTEALLRWQKPGNIVTPPSDFIPLAEETGLIVPLGEWVLRTACKQARDWSDHGINLQMAVNISARQLQEQNLPAMIEQILSETCLAPQVLQLEITESAAMQDFNLTIKTLNDLQRLGVTIAIDDFGTSYSSLSYLKDFPINSLKIDKTFIDNIYQNPNDAALTTAIIALGHYLNLYVTAEGVETKYQLQFLSSQYCDEIQGYYISHPLKSDIITERLYKKYKWLTEEADS